MSVHEQGELFDENCIICQRQMDTYNVEKTIRQRLYREWREAWLRDNDRRCARILGEFKPMPTEFHPCADRVLIRPDTEGGEKRTASGLIIIPDIGKTRPTTGIVVAIGPDCHETFDVGDKVLFGKYAGADIKLNEEEMTIVRQEDILGVITEEADEGTIDKGSSEPDPPTELAGSRGASDR